ncbi:Sir2 histone deacetylase Hst2 [Serendipita sp. 405]|nr:Sir2 histone deacetylase Hst2 [Serendipita sp. 397]KAG8834056.1 Sir2 histone deacetylase Hst2 [Serendipita sp. 405]
MREMIKKGEVPTCPECEGLVKPDIVFFGEGLPPEFRNAIPALRTKASLVIVMGTSLTVQPFSLLPNLVPISCPRLLLNMDPAGNIGAFVKDRSSSPVPAPGSGGGGPADETGLSQQSNDQEQGNVEKSGGEEKVAGHVDRQSHPDRVEASRGLSTSGLNDRSSSEQRNHEEEAREDAGDDLSDEYEDEYEDEEEDEEEEEEEEVERWQDDVVHLGDCDTSVRVLCDLLGWRDDLERLWRSVGGGGGNPDVDDVVGGGSAQATNFAAGSDKPNRVPIGAAMAEVTQSRNQDTSTSVKFINTNESNGMGRLVLSSADAELAVGVIPSTEQDKGNGNAFYSLFFLISDFLSLSLSLSYFSLFPCPFLWEPG